MVELVNEVLFANRCVLEVLLGKLVLLVENLADVLD